MPSAESLSSATNPPGKSSRPHDEDARGVSWPTTTQMLIVLGLYFGLQLSLRSWISGSADLDEADQLVLTQKLLLGYGPQPPLYTWIQIGFFKMFGVSIFALALFKNLLLLGTYLLTYLNTRFVTGRHDCGAVAAASLLFIPQIAWESQRDLTHSVLASTLTMATLFLFFQVRTRPRPGVYAALGFCIGAGLLSKLNYALFLCGLIAAGISLREFRTVVLNRRMLVAAGIVLAMILPTGLWILQHQHLAFASVSKFHIKESIGWGASVTKGLSSAAKSTLTFIGPLILVYVLVFWRKPSREWFRPRSDSGRLLLRMLAATAVLLILAIVVFRVRDIRDRWLQPLLIWTPVLWISLLQPQLDRKRFKVIVAVAAAVALLVSMFIPGRILLAERFHRTEPLNRPFDQLARELQPAVAGASAIVTDTRLLAGNLRLNIPERTCLVPDLAPLFLQPGQPCALVWEATEKTNLPANLVAFAEAHGLSDLTNAPARYFSATFKFHQRRQMRIGVIVPPENRRQ